MASLLDRLRDDGLPEPPVTPQDHRIEVHYFFAAMVGLADGQFTRAQIEAHFDILTTGQDKAQFDAIISGYQAAADKGRYLDALHASLMLVESGVALSNAQIQAWLTAAEAAYP